MADLSKVNMLELLAELEKRGSFKTIIFNKADGKQGDCCNLTFISYDYY